MVWWIPHWSWRLLAIQASCNLCFHTFQLLFSCRYLEIILLLLLVEVFSRPTVSLPRFIKLDILWLMLDWGGHSSSNNFYFDRLLLYGSWLLRDLVSCGIPSGTSESWGRRGKALRSWGSYRFINVASCLTGVRAGVWFLLFHVNDSRFSVNLADSNAWEVNKLVFFFMQMA